jgi:hypothetical protein
LSSRSLKIEAEGDYASRKIKPKIRLQGKWLEHAGFKPGSRVSVISISLGVIELRSENPDAGLLHETGNPS